MITLLSLSQRSSLESSLRAEQKSGGPDTIVKRYKILTMEKRVRNCMMFMIICLELAIRLAAGLI